MAKIKNIAASIKFLFLKKYMQQGTDIINADSDK